MQINIDIRHEDMENATKKANIPEIVSTVAFLGETGTPDLQTWLCDGEREREREREREVHTLLKTFVDFRNSFNLSALPPLFPPLNPLSDRRRVLAQLYCVRQRRRVRAHLHYVSGVRQV